MKMIIRFLPVLLLGLFFGSCQKYNQIDNSSTVKTPYVLFIGGYNGTLHKTNDALYFNTLFPTDNSIVRSVVVADTMLLYLKQNFYFSRDEGRSFKNSNGGGNVPYIDQFYKYFIPNGALYDKVEKRVYLCTNTDGNKTTNLDLKVSTDNGENFSNETNWAIGSSTIYPTSITQLKNNDLYIIQDSANIYKKIGTGSWTQVIQADSNMLPTDTTTWYLAHKGDTLIAIDFNGKAGVWYSTNGADDWYKCTGMPKSRKILFGNQASGNDVFYIGYDSAGLYRLEGNTFKATSAGIPWYAKVGFVEGKTVIYRTDRTRTYLYCSTDQGLYISETNGLDWRLLRSGTYSTLR